LLELKRVYENPKYLFIVYEYFKGESLFKIIKSGIELHEVQIASVINKIIFEDYLLNFSTDQILKSTPILPWKHQSLEHIDQYAEFNAPDFSH
jgi:calcium-dependent protein kinase